MTVDPQLAESIKKNVQPLIDSVLAGALVAATAALIDELVVTNYEKDTLTGKTEMHPTEEKTAMSKSETDAESTEGKLSHDQVSAQSGEVKASEVDASAQTAEATAMEDGATAVRTKAGASDIEVKALKMT